MKTISLFAAAAFVAAGFSAAQAQDIQQGSLTISHVWARPTAEGQKNGAAYLTIKNNGKEAERLVSAESPAAGKTELHETIMDNGVMKMRAVTAGVEIAPGAVAEFKPGGGHVMFLGLKNKLEEGKGIPVTLTFAKAGAIKVEAKVEKGAAAGGGDAHHGHH